MPAPTPPPHMVKEWNIAAKAVEAYKTLGSGVNMRFRKVSIKAQGRDRIQEEGDEGEKDEEKDEDEDSDDADAKYDSEFNLEADKKPETDVEEVWFAGCHCGQSHRALPRTNTDVDFDMQTSAVAPCAMAHGTTLHASRCGG